MQPEISDFLASIMKWIRISWLTFGTQKSWGQEFVRISVGPGLEWGSAIQCPLVGRNYEKSFDENFFGKEMEKGREGLERFLKLYISGETMDREFLKENRIS